MIIRFFFLLLLSLFLFSCTIHKATIQAGANYSDFDKGESTGHINYIFGIANESPTPAKFRTSWEFLVSKRDVTLRNQVESHYEAGMQGISFYDFRVSLQFFELIYSLRYEIHEKNGISIESYIAPSVSFCLDDSKRIRFTYYPDMPPIEKDFYYPDAEPPFYGKNVDAGINFGFKVRRKNYLLDFRYYHGIKELDSVEGALGFDQKWRTFILMVGYTI